jgi:hypothetical protein
MINNVKHRALFDEIVKLPDGVDFLFAMKEGGDMIKRLEKELIEEKALVLALVKMHETVISTPAIQQLMPLTVKEIREIITEIKQRYEDELPTPDRQQD